MNAHIQFHDKIYSADLQRPLDISLSIHDGVENPNCYGADAVLFETITADNFIGSIREGGSVNHKKIHLSPHGNGTHTECYAHIIDTPDTLNQCLKDFHFMGELITLSPTLLSNGDQVVLLPSIQEKIRTRAPQALLIRTLPNANDKRKRHYTGTNPPYFEKEALAWMARSGIMHLVVDLPSVDKEVDGGKLEAHHAFWKTFSAIRKGATITELAFIDTEIKDGLYLLNLQIISLELDASPSKPVLYKLKEVY